MPKDDSTRPRRTIILSLELAVFIIAAVILIAFQIKYQIMDKTGADEGGPDEITFREGQTVPDFPLNLLEGSPTTLSSICAAKPVLLLFVEQGCAPCELQMSSLAQAASNNDKYQVVLVTFDSEAWIAKTMAERQANFPVIMDPNHELFKAFGVVGYPTVVLLGADRKVLFHQVGFEASLGAKINWTLSGGGGRSQWP